MKFKLLMVAVLITAIALGFALFSCAEEEAENRERVTVKFEIGHTDAGAENPSDVVIFKGTALGNRLPAPTRMGYSLEGWFISNRKIDAGTIIDQDMTLRARWDELSGVADQPSSAEIGSLFINDPENPNSFPLILSDSKKIWGMRSPAITFAYTADPTPMVFCHANPPCLRHSGDTEENWCDECVLYIYGSNDTLVFRGDFPNEAPDAAINTTDNFDYVIQGLRIISTRDLANWTEHGVVNVTGKNSTHALWPYTSADRQIQFANNTWAPSAEWKMVDGKPRFFLYFCDGGNATTVLISDDGPTGPFYSPPSLTSNMINKNMPIGSGVSWLFDPGTFIDDDGRAYMFLGGDGRTADPGNARRTELSDDMISSITTDASIYRVNLYWHFEATDIWKWQGIYYVNYTTNWSATPTININVVMNRSGPLAEFPTNPNVWGGPRSILPSPQGPYTDDTNHASLFDFKGKPYMVYHTESAANAYGADRLRGAHVTPIEIADNGEIAWQTLNVVGAPQVGDYDPYVVQEAETVYITGGVYTKYDANANNKAVIASIDTGDWLGLYGVNFDIKSGGATKFNAIVKLPVTEGDEKYIGAIEIRKNVQRQGMENATGTTSDSVLAPGEKRTRITGGEVIGRMQLEVKEKSDEGKWILAKVDLDEPITGKHNLAFVFYSSRGAKLEHYLAPVTPATDGRRNNVGFEIDQWWFQ